MDISHAQGERLAQVKPSVTTAVNLLTADELAIEVTLITACIVAGGASSLTVHLYHDDDGVVYDDDSIITVETRNALIQSSVIFQAQHPGSGIIIRPGGSLGVLTSVANDVNFCAYGHTEDRAERPQFS